MKAGTILALTTIAGGSALLYHYSKLQELNLKLVDIQTGVQTQQNNFAKIQAQDSAVFGSNVVTIQTQLLSLQPQYTQANSQYQQAQRNYSQGNTAELQDLASLQQQVAGYKDKLDKIVQALSLLSDAYTSAKSQLSAIQTSLGTLKQQLSAITKKNPNEDVQLQQQLQGRISQLSGQVDAEIQKYSQVPGLYQQAQTQQTQMQQLQSQLNQLEPQIKARLAASRIDQNYSTSTFSVTNGAGMAYNPYSINTPTTAAKTYSGTNSIGTTATYQELPDGTYKIIASSNPNAVGMILNYGQVLANLDTNVTVGTASVASTSSTSSTQSTSSGSGGHYETRQVQTGTHQVCTTQQVAVNHATYHPTFYPWTDINGKITDAHYGPPGSYGAPYWTTYESKQVCHDEPTYTTQQVWVAN